MKRSSVVVALALALCGCSRETEQETPKPEMSAPVKEAIYRICRLERASTADHSAKIVDVRGMSAAAFRRVLEKFPGQDVHVWMPGAHDWLLVGNLSTNAVPLARAMDDFAADTNCTMSVAEVFASYAGTREEILPAFQANLVGDVLPEWFVTENVPALNWLDGADIDEDILRLTLARIRSAQVVRRLVLKGNMLAAKATDKKEEEAAIDCWTRAALRNPNDPMLLERMENLNRNAKGFLEVGKVLQAMKCYETIVLVRPWDAAAVHNFGMCLKKIGKLDFAEKVLIRARELAEKTPLRNQGEL